jgi:ABC-type molybdate transport system substrate-binding protein
MKISGAPAKFSASALIRILATRLIHEFTKNHEEPLSALVAASIDVYRTISLGATLTVCFSTASTRVALMDKLRRSSGSFSVPTSR